jgi:hypothetical protein
MTDRMETFLEGASAFVNLYGVVPIMVPYPEDTDEWWDWNAGFQAASMYKLRIVKENE